MQVGAGCMCISCNHVDGRLEGADWLADGGGPACRCGWRWVARASTYVVVPRMCATCCWRATRGAPRTGSLQLHLWHLNRSTKCGTGMASSLENS